MTVMDPTVGTVPSADGTVIAFERIGSGPPVVLVDGAMLFRRFGPMAALARRLATDFTVHTYDRRGRGESGDTQPYAVEREVEDLDAMITVAGGAACVYGMSSGGLLALLAAAAELDISRLALFEPPIGRDPSATAPLRAEMTELVRAGRRWEAVQRFQVALDMSAEMIDQMATFRPALEPIAPTLVYDLTLASAAGLAAIAGVLTPTLVLDSTGSSDRLQASTEAVTETLPNGTHRRLSGSWHDVPADQLAPVLTDFFDGR